MIERLKRYCSCISPSGCEDEIREIIINDIKNTTTSYEVDCMGNLTAFKKGRRTPQKKILLSAHMDEVGLMMKYISDEGYIYFEPIGGIDPRVVGGRRILIGDNRINGIVASKAIHLQKKSERGIVIPLEEMYIDIGCTDKESCEKLVSVGDVATFVPNFEEFGDSLIKSKAIDDRFGCALLVEIIKEELEYDTYFAFPTCEEIGTDGAKEVAYNLRPDIVIVIEATTAGDVEGAPKARHACELRGGGVVSHMDGGTIYDKELVELALKTAKENNIKCQLKNVIAGGNDSSAYQKAASGARVMAISAPARYIHSASNVVCKDDLFEIKKLVSALLKKEL
jgi:endoglucanase